MNKTITITKKDFQTSVRILSADVEREIWLAGSASNTERKNGLTKLGMPHAGGANLLVALGLLCFSEYAGWLRYNNRTSKGQAQATKNFNSLFDSIGEGYAKLNKEHDIYGILRCGMVHQYYAKQPYTVMMPGLVKGTGITHKNGHYWMYVESYYRDLKNRLATIENEVDFPAKRPYR